MSFYANVKDLPASIQSGLQLAGYGKADVEIKIERELSLESSGMGDGYQGFTVLVNLDTEEVEGHVGSWGGRNPFESRPVDTDTKLYQLPDNGAVIKGQRGGGRPVMARVYLNPAAAPKELTSGQSELSEREIDILGCFTSYTSTYRREIFSQKKVTTEEWDSLVARGYVKRNKAGALSVTTAGKNVPRRTEWR